MKQRFLSHARPLTVLIAMVFTAGAVMAREHPFLFVTQRQVADIRQAVASSAEIRGLADKLVAEARKTAGGSLPALERDWWVQEKSRSYMDVDNIKLLKNTHAYLSAFANRALLLARAHVLAPGEGFGEQGKQVLLQMSEHPCEFENVNAGLYYAVPSATALEAYDILYEVFSATERLRIDAYFMRVLQVVQRCNAYWIEHEPGGPLNNHYGWHKVAIMMIGLFYDRRELVKSAIFGSHGYDYALQHGFHDDGIWLEGSLPYHFVQVNAMLRMAQMTHNTGYTIDLFDYVTADGRNIKQAYDAMISMALPNRQIPPIGDGYGRTTVLADESGYESIYRRYRDPTHAWLIGTKTQRGYDALFYGVNELPKISPPPQRTRLWLEHGIAALRSVEGPEYWSGRGWTLMAVFGNNFTHHHADKLSISLFGDSHYWLPDAESKISAAATFNSTFNQELNWTSLSHNGVIIDWKNQERSPTKPMRIVEFASTPQVKRLTVGDPSGLLYPGVRQMRTCLIRDDYVLDVVQVCSAQVSDISWIVHVDGEAEMSSFDKWRPYILPTDGPWRFIRQPEVADEITRHFGESFVHEDKKLRFDIWTDTEAKVIRCGFPREDSSNSPLLPMRIVSCHGRRAIFAAVYRLGSTADLPIKVAIETGAMKTLAITVQLGDESNTHVIPIIDDNTP